jgi:uncharacterized protein (PEP-CTERM system associated)
MPRRPPMHRRHLAAVATLTAIAGAVCPVARAQEEPASASLPTQEEPARRQPFLIESSASVTETITNNNGLSSGEKKTEYITQATLGVRGSANSARLKGYLDYSLSGLVYGRNTASNELQNALSALATAELIQNRAYIDVGAGISQQLLSAFGPRSVDPAIANANRVETRSFSVSPYVRGRLGSAADYELRLAYDRTDAGSSVASDNSNASALARIGGATPLARLGWSVEASRSEIDYSLGRRTEEDLARGVLTWAVTPQFSVSAIGGAEANNYVTLDKESHKFAGFGLNWRPSERTSLSAQRENRFFGESHTVAFAYRTPRTAWAFSDVRGVNSTPNRSTLGSLGSVFDLYYLQFASVEPDPVLRRQLVDAFLRGNGIDPNSQVFATFLTSGVTLQRVQTLSFAVLGVRDTVTLAATQTENRRLDVALLGNDDFSSATQIKERGLSVALSRRLTPITAVSFTGSYQRTTGSLDAQTTSLKTLAALWTQRLGRRTDLSMGARHARFGSTTAPYNETAVYATLGLQF